MPDFTKSPKDCFGQSLFLSNGTLNQDCRLLLSSEKLLKEYLANYHPDFLPHYESIV